MMSRLRLAALAAAIVLGPLPGAVAGGYPERPVQLVVPFTAGGAADVLARILSHELEGQLGRPLVVVNKPGAGTLIGAQAVANAQADGYTLLISSNSTFSMNPAVHSKMPYDTATGFEPVAMVATLALAVVVKEPTPFANLGQLVSAAKAAPGKYMYASFGNATSAHFAGEMFKLAAGIDLVHVPYRGSSPAMTDLLGERVALSVDTVVAALPYIKAGQMKALAVTTAQRSILLPEVPTVAESGYPGFDLTPWIALVGPRGLPPEAKSRLTQALAEVLRRTEVQEKLKAIGFEPAFAPIDDWAALVTKDIARMKDTATRANIRAD
jgi:tripartite-type tricarboxylate transporter receptor subunit TctC